MFTPHSTTSITTLRAPSVGRRAVIAAVLAVLIVVAIVAVVTSHTASTSASSAGAGSSTPLIQYRGLGAAPTTTAATPSPATIGLARAEHSYGLVP